MTRFTDQCVVVTGGASGIGRATATRIAAEGGRVAILDVADLGGSSTVSDIERNGGSSIAIECDVADADAVPRSIAAAVEWGGRLDALVNCAGTGFHRRVQDTSRSELERVMAVNFTGSFATCQAALGALGETQGSIVNVASAAALRGSAYLTAYSASKGAMVAFTKSLAVEIGETGVRANCVCPGGVDTPLLRLFAPPEDANEVLLGRSAGVTGRMSTPEEIAASIAFLASNEASQITGAVLVVDGGSIA
ncbi:MAG: SDR family oxidoreductase [Ilumatobacteraceae bacterium]|nr:SDR family oxidoreductase [Ilumatobacteraceae bacterium]